PRARPFRLRAGERDDGGATSAKGNQSGSNRLFSATSAALTRVKGMSIRSGSDGRVLNPRSMTLASTLFSPSRKNGGNGDHAFKGVEKISKKDSSSNSERDVSSDSSGPLLFEEIDGQGDRATAGDGGRSGGGGIGSNKSNKQKLSVLFDDDESEAENVSEGRGTMSTNSDGGGQENTPTPRSQWASTLMASTLAREKSTGKTTVRGRVGLLPRPRDARNKVEYLVMVCKAAQNYASTQASRLSRVRDGQHMISQLRDVASDLNRQADKILAVYDTREVSRSADRLGETLKGVYDLLGDVEGTSIMFGRKRGFGKRVTALVHDIGTRANALLAATSLAIADRPNVLYLADTGASEPPAPQKEELLKMCIEGDKFFFGRGDKPNMRRAFEAYSSAAERGCAEAMYMTAWMHRIGSSSSSSSSSSSNDNNKNNNVNADDAEQCRLWLERAAVKGYPPAMNDLATTLLGEADRTERAHPELRTDAGCGAAVDASAGSTKRRRQHGGDADDDDNQGAGDDCDDAATATDGAGGAGAGAGAGAEAEVKEDSGSLPPELAQLFEQVMEKRKRSMQLLQDAAKTGHTEAMTNLGNMQEAMGYFEDARSWYSLAAHPSEAANSPRAQNYLGTLFYEGRGVTRDTDKASRWFRLSARQGFPQACQNLGICYQAGVGVVKDLPKAVGLFRQAVEGGSVAAANNLAYLLARDALHTLAAATRQAPRGLDHHHHGDSSNISAGIACTGLQFEDPSRGMMKAVPLSCEASRKVWRESTAQLREAADLFRRAADSGIGDASYQLGRLYQQGLGIPLDPVAAFDNFLAAADGEAVHPTAGEGGMGGGGAGTGKLKVYPACVGDMLYTGTGCQRNYRAAVRYYLRAAHAGDASSANAVGLLHELGRGVTRNMGTASCWYQRAAELGSADGAFNAALLLERGDPLSAVAMAAGLPMFQEHRYRAPSPSHLPLQQSNGAGAGPSTTTAPPPPPPAGKNATGSSQQNIDGSCVETTTTTGEGGERRLWGSRPLALQMFQRAAELGHPEAMREVQRLRLRERMEP
ncbi:unnamed protein product, partial [Pylaiella littoralis]